jgi:2-hydroxycyclohexanecarboxyl-CoA dehydrogenase
VRLRDRVAVVTGAASGIGRAIALALAAEGARVAVLDLDEAGAVAVAAEIANAKGGDAHPWQVDVADAARVQTAIEGVIRRWSTVQILVNCAGWDRPIPFVETTPDFWDKILAINLKGPIACTRAVLPAMIAQGYGKIVSIASDAGRVGSTGEAVYSAAKGGLIAFTKTIARETARHRINVNCVCPGPSDTPLFQKEFAGPSPKLAESLKRVIPWGRLGTPEDIAPAVVFLASDDAGYITGQTLSVSGGLTMV